MPDITLAYAPSAGGISDAAGFNGDIYTPTSRTSFETVDGWLDRDNREVSGAAWKVPWDKIRPRSMAEAQRALAFLRHNGFRRAALPLYTAGVVTWTPAPARNRLAIPTDPLLPPAATPPAPPPPYWRPSAGPAS
jgi:hypothetical protein